jgi:glycosyltransferase involved in cell wall biosynthesis
VNLRVARPHRRETLLVEPTGLDKVRARRVVVVTGAVIPEQLALWYGVRDLGIKLTIVGTDANIYRGRWPWYPRKPPGLDCVLLRPLSPAVQRGHLWWVYRGLSRILTQTRPDLVHILSEPWGALVLQTLLLRRRQETRARVCVHGADNIFSHGSRPEQFARRFILSRVWSGIDGFVSWSQEGIDAARREGLPPIPTAVIPAVIPDPSQFLPSSPDRTALRAKFRLPVDEPVVGFIGRLDEEKGIRDLLQAARLLGPSGPFFSVWGAGPLEKVVRRHLSAGQVRGSFGGALSLAAVPEALRACDVLVVPSRTTPAWKEQFGRIIVEAMLAGSAVVAYRSGAIPEVVGEGGLLVDEGDVGGLATSILRTANDASFRSDLATTAMKEALSRFHPEVVGDRLVRLWSEVMSRWAS